MQRIAFRSLAAAFILVAGFAVAAFSSFSSVSAQSTGQPVDSPCVTGVTMEVLGQTLPASADGQALVALRLTIAPGGGFDPHTHPGAVTVAIESGTFMFTNLEQHDMPINRASSDGTPGPVEMLAANAETQLNAGDWLAEEDMVHEAWNRSDQPTVVIVSGLIDPTQPFVQCVNTAG